MIGPGKGGSSRGSDIPTANVGFYCSRERERFERPAGKRRRPGITGTPARQRRVGENKGVQGNPRPPRSANSKDRPRPDSNLRGAPAAVSPARHRKIQAGKVVYST